MITPENIGMKMIQEELHTPLLTVAFISGKGGVGKSMTSVNTAETLRSMGYRVALLDVDLGMSNCATLLNEPAGHCVSNWIRGECSLEDLPQECHGITLVTGSDDPDYSSIPPDLMLDALDQVLAWLATEHHFVIIDTPAGIGDTVLWALERAELGTVVLVDEPTSISDVYRLCKYVYGMDPDYPFSCIVNRAKNETSATETFRRFNSILSYFMQKQALYLGFVPASPLILDSIRNQSPFMRKIESAAGLDRSPEEAEEDASEAIAVVGHPEAGAHRPDSGQPGTGTERAVRAGETSAGTADAPYPSGSDASPGGMAEEQRILQEFQYIGHNLVGYARKQNRLPA